MTSPPTNFTFGSASSAQNVRDAIASYRRAQYLLAGSAVCSASDSSDILGDEESGTSQINEGVDEDFEALADGDRTPSTRHDFIGEFEWDDIDEPGQSEPLGSHVVVPTRFSPVQQTRPFLVPVATSPPIKIGPHEGTPLLRKVVSFSNDPHPRRMSATPAMVIDATTTLSDQTSYSSALQAPPLLRRRSSGSSNKSFRYNYGGKSTFGQTLFNSIAILLGIGMLSEPLAFAYAGWFAGTILILFYGFLTCYTAKILARIILSDPRLRSYADIGRKAFGPRSTLMISVMFCLELFAVSVVLVTLYADSLHTIFPQYSADAYKLWGLVLLIPTVFLPLSLLSYTSILGIISIILLTAVIIIDGLSKRESPGSLWNPAVTSVGVDSWGNLGIAFGLFMAGFSGHAVIPSLARDMTDPTQFDTMINCAFVIATLTYTLIGCAGYLMFGMAVSDEISVDLLNTPGYNPILNQAALWMLVISPLSKFALATQPLNATIEILFGLDPPLGSPEEFSGKMTPPAQGSSYVIKRILSVVQRVFFTVLSVGVSILVPEFSSMMAFLGSFSAFLICVIGPIAAKMVMTGRCGIFDSAILVVASIMAVWGTLAAFWST